MLLLQSLSLQKPPPLSLSVSPFSLINKRRLLFISPFILDGGDHGRPKIRMTNLSHHRAVEKDSEFEVDPDKAREALQKLDQQLQSLSQKRTTPPKIRAPELKYARDQMREEIPEISGSSLPFLAFSLLIFTVFYNILFLTVIKPSIDGPEPVPATTTEVRGAPKTAVLQQLPPTPEVPGQY